MEAKSRPWWWCCREVVQWRQGAVLAAPLLVVHVDARRWCLQLRPRAHELQVLVAMTMMASFGVACGGAALVMRATMLHTHVRGSGCVDRHRGLAAMWAIGR